ncbi:sodium/calcium exchanger 2-like isoform X2 [Artemia franciscana]|uniref:sodium/calcium exchanger 2-like isoform X2 n=1 Tax=Artemia franciscana TaxID=6661 RepID=UPI0032DB7320
MTQNNGTLHDYQCSSGLLLPLINEFTWAVEVRAFLYLFGLLYCFMGVAIIADIFMGAIEKITSTTKKVFLSRGPGVEDEVLEVRIWNDTVANLTLMALGSSAPEILLSIIEIIGNNFEAGELGPGTIVGSAAFNLMIIAGICIVAIPDGETRRIKGIRVFAVTAAFSLLAYIWLVVVLVAVSPDEVEVWEGLVTLLLFPLLVCMAYLTDKGSFPCWKSIKVTNDGQIELGRKQSGVAMILPSDQNWSLIKNGKIDSDALVAFCRRVSKLGLTQEEAARLAACRLVDCQPHDRLYYRIGAVRSMTGSRKLKPQLSLKLQQALKKDPVLGALILGPLSILTLPLFSVQQDKILHDMGKKIYEAINDNPEVPDIGPYIEPDENHVSIVEFQAFSLAILESIGKFQVTITRSGRLDNGVAVRVESIDGSAKAGEDYKAVDEVVFFEPNVIEKKINVDIIDDNQYEPDEQFYLKLSLMNNKGRYYTVSNGTGNHENSNLDLTTEGEEESVHLGTRSIMEITILNDDQPGIITFNERGLLVKESVNAAIVNIHRRNGTDGIVSVKWRTLPQTAKEGIDFKGGSGIITFEHQVDRFQLEIPIFMTPELSKDRYFEIELSEPEGGATIGSIPRMAITITDDAEFNLMLKRITKMTSTTLRDFEVHHETWLSQLRDAMNVNGGDLENATRFDYFMHFLTFGWKILFALVPPAGLLGGWLCFFTSMAVIGFLTAIIGDLAAIFGCLVGLKDGVTAITFVALGTSLPDLFASKVAACQENSADNSIGNITGSNSVNVFLGLGLPWVLASIYHAVKGDKFVVRAGSLSFGVVVFTVCAILTITLLVCRRKLNIFGRAELGGPTATKYISCSILFLLWIIYILLSSFQAYGYIPGF